MPSRRRRPERRNVLAAVGALVCLAAPAAVADQSVLRPIAARFAELRGGVETQLGLASDGKGQVGVYDYQWENMCTENAGAVDDAAPRDLCCPAECGGCGGMFCKGLSGASAGSNAQCCPSQNVTETGLCNLTDVQLPCLLPETFHQGTATFVNGSGDMSIADMISGLFSSGNTGEGFQPGTFNTTNYDGRISAEAPAGPLAPGAGPLDSFSDEKRAKLKRQLAVVVGVLALFSLLVGCSSLFKSHRAASRRGQEKLLEPPEIGAAAYGSTDDDDDRSQKQKVPSAAVLATHLTDEAMRSLAERQTDVEEMSQMDLVSCRPLCACACVQALCVCRPLSCCVCG